LQRYWRHIVTRTPPLLAAFVNGRGSPQSHSQSDACSPCARDRLVQQGYCECNEQGAAPSTAFSSGRTSTCTCTQAYTHTLRTPSSVMQRVVPHVLRALFVCCVWVSCHQLVPAGNHPSCHQNATKCHESSGLLALIDGSCIAVNTIPRTNTAQVSLRVSYPPSDHVVDGTEKSVHLPGHVIVVYAAVVHGFKITLAQRALTPLKPPQRSVVVYGDAIHVAACN